MNPYLAPAVAFGSMVSLVQYVALLKPLSRRGASIVTLMVATIAFELILLAALDIYADYMVKAF